MAIVLQGPGDKLSAGLLAGMKIAATFASLNAVKQQNALRAREVVIREETAVFTRKALASQTKATDATANLANSRMGHIDEIFNANLKSIKGKTSAEQQEALRETIAAMIDVSDDDLTMEEAGITARASMEQNQVVDNEANVMATTMIVRGMHSQARAELDVEHRRSDAFALRAATSAVGAIPPEYEALMSGQLSRIRGLDTEILTMNRIGRYLGPESGIDTDTADLKAERDVSTQLILDLGSAFRSGGLGRGQANPNIPTISNDAAGQEAYRRLDVGQKYLDVNGDVHTKR